VQFRLTPWVDWTNYWAPATWPPCLPASSLPRAPSFAESPAHSSILEFERVELVKFNLFDNSGTYQDFINGRGGVGGQALKTWPQMRLPATDPNYTAVGGAGEQVCKGDSFADAPSTAKCNDVRNPSWVPLETLFARNVEFDTALPEQGASEYTRNRHDGRLTLTTPDPEVISRVLFTRNQSTPDTCSSASACPTTPSTPTATTRSAFLQRPRRLLDPVHDPTTGSRTWKKATTPAIRRHRLQKQARRRRRSTAHPRDIQKLGCRPADQVDKALRRSGHRTRHLQGQRKDYQTRAAKTFTNTNTAWWMPRRFTATTTHPERVKRDPSDPRASSLDPARSISHPRTGSSFLPVLQPFRSAGAHMGRSESGASPILHHRLSFLHNLFVREHNSFVTEFRSSQLSHTHSDKRPPQPIQSHARHRLQRCLADELYRRD